VSNADQVEPGSSAATAGPATEADRAELAPEASSDPFAEARAGFEADGYEVARHDNVWIVSGRFSNSRRIAARAVTEFAAPVGVVAVAVSDRRATIMLRRDSTLVMADSTIRQWRTFEVRPPVTPASLFAGGEELPTARSVTPLSAVPDHVAQLVAGLGVNVTQLVHVFLPPVRR
jgi:hypothetical protein